MRQTTRLLACALLSASALMSTTPAADARRGGWHGHGHHGHWGRGAAIGLGAAIIGGALLGSRYGYRHGPTYYYDGGDYDDDAPAYDGEARCRATFRSYDPDSGTYTGYDGVVRRCPYL